MRNWFKNLSKPKKNFLHFLTIALFFIFPIASESNANPFLMILWIIDTVFAICFLVWRKKDKQGEREKSDIKDTYVESTQTTYVPEWKKLTITKDFGGYIKFDEKNKKWFIPDGLFGKIKNPKIYDFKDIIDFELLEDGNSITKGGVGRALVGGVLFGGVGAIVGGSTGKKHIKSTCTRMQIKITINSMENPVRYITFISSETKKDSIIYKTAFNFAQNILSVLQIICANNQGLEKVGEQNNALFDELVKYKELLEDGVITQEEFDAKKKQALGL